MSHFDQAFTDLLGHEGGYSNNPADPGGETMWGITADVASEHGYTGKMIDMPQEVAKRIYAESYWLSAFDRLPYKVAFTLFDAAVNSGVGQSVRWLQRALHVADDGKLGPITLAAAIQANPEMLLLSFNGERLDFMTRLSTWQTFGKGWARRIASNLKKGSL
jgi:lysozyme family protein